MKRILIIVASILLVLVLLAVVSFVRGGDGTPSVSTETIERRDLVATVSASGNIRARRQVDVSAEISARVVELRVEEGDDVLVGDTLLQLERTRFEAALQRAQASLSQARAQLTQSRASQLRAQRTFERTAQLRAATPPVVSEQEYEEAETSLEVANANLDATEFSVQQAEAGVAEAQDDLARTVFTAPMDGKITRLNVEEGETVIIGTMNNPGSLVLSVSDLSVVELVTEVDETDVPRISLGDSAVVEIDAFPDRTFAGRVTQIGNSAVRPPSSQGSSQPAIDFEVVITIDASGVALRPDLSATAQIVTDQAKDVVAVPIIALQLRDREDVDSTRFELPPPTDAEIQDVEGVFVMDGNRVSFRPVMIGITGQEHFEVISGLEEGVEIAAGPYQVLRQLTDGDVVAVSGGAPDPGN